MKNIIKVITLCPVLSYAGQFIDKESMGNTSYLNARYLNHNLGRFLNQDALQEYNGHYSYQHGDVMLFSDPSGLGNSDDEGGILGAVDSIVDDIFKEDDLPPPPPKEEVTKEAGKEDPEHAKDTNSVIDAGSGVTHGKGDLADQSGTTSSTPPAFDYDAASLGGKFEAIPHLQDLEENTPHESYSKRSKKRVKVKQLDELSSSKSSSSEQSDMETGYTVQKHPPAPRYHSQNSNDLGEYDVEPRYRSESMDEKAKRRAKFTDKIAIGIFVGVLFFTIAGTAMGFHFMGAF